METLQEQEREERIDALLYDLSVINDTSDAFEKARELRMLVAGKEPPSNETLATTTPAYAKSIGTQHSLRLSVWPTASCVFLSSFVAGFFLGRSDLWSPILSPYWWLYTLILMAVTGLVFRASARKESRRDRYQEGLRERQPKRAEGEEKEKQPVSSAANR